MQAMMPIRKYNVERTRACGLAGSQDVHMHMHAMLNSNKSFFQMQPLP